MSLARQSTALVLAAKFTVTTENHPQNTKTLIKHKETGRS